MSTSVNDSAIVAALATGLGDHETARVANCSPKTVQRRRALPDATRRERGRLAGGRHRLRRPHRPR